MDELRNGRAEMIRATGAVLIASVLLYFWQVLCLTSDPTNFEYTFRLMILKLTRRAPAFLLAPRKIVADPMILANIFAGFTPEDRLSITLDDVSLHNPPVSSANSNGNSS